MALVQSVVVPIDFSPSSECGARLAAHLAQRLKAAAILVHAVPVRRAVDASGEAAYEGGESPNEADAYWAERLAEVAQQAGFGASAEQIVVEGEPAAAICKLAQQRRADLIVLATRGFGEYRADLLGSNTAKVLHDAAMPVLTTVHRGQPAVEVRPVKRIVCSVDLSSPNVEALRWARGMADELRASLAALYVAPELPIEDEARSDFRSTLLASSRRRMSEVLESAGVEAEAAIEVGELGPAAAEAVRRLSADLLVLGRRCEGQGRITGHAFEILRSSACPVVSV